MAEIDWPRFGQAFAARLDALGYSFDRAVEKWPQTDKAMLSRACRGVTLSAGNLLLLCEMGGLDPFAFLDRDKQRRLTLQAVADQHVTAAVSRVTLRQAQGEADA